MFLFLQHPVKTYVYAGILSFMGYMGVNFVLTMIKTFGALLAVTGKDSEGAYWNKNTEGFASLMAATGKDLDMLDRWQDIRI